MGRKRIHPIKHTQSLADRLAFDVLVFEDLLGYKDGAVTGQSWELPWTANLLSDDEAFRRVFFAASQAVSGREVFVWQEDAPQMALQ